MTVEIMPPARPGQVALADDSVLTEDAVRLISESLTPNTRKSYSSALRTFSAWCAEQGRADMPATSATLASFVAALAEQGRSPSTINVAISAVRAAHLFMRRPRPDDGEARQALKAVKAARGRAKVGPRKAAAMTAEPLEATLAAMPDRPHLAAINTRDRALLVLAYCGLFRRSELLGLDRGDVEEHRDRIVVTLWESKTNHSGEAEHVTLWLTPGAEDVCPVRTLAAWLAVLDEAGHHDGPVFRSVGKGGRVGGRRMSGDAFSDMVGRRAAAAGLIDEASTKRFTGHSMRRGMATDLGWMGKSAADIRKAGRWASTSSVHLEYVEPVEDARHAPTQDAQTALADLAHRRAAPRPR